VYRDKLNNNTYFSDELDKNNNISTYVLSVDMNGVLDNIETRVNEIKDILDSIQGLSEIDEVKELLKTLSKDLY